MDWSQVILFCIGVFFGMFFWNRAQSRTDFRMMLGMIDAIRQEMKDFHGRLCAIEERNKGKEK